MALEKKSKQRSAILAELSARTDHPTAEEIYFSLKAEFPNLSLGTVYRNLSQLSEKGAILKLTCSGADHFDYTTDQHYHLYCSCCHRLYDLDMPVTDDLEAQAQQHFKGKITDHRLTFFGVCEKCVPTQN